MRVAVQKESMKKVIPDLFLQSAHASKEKIAFHYFDTQWKSITYHEFLAAVQGIASYLVGNGLHKGDRIAIYSENRPEWCMAYLGISLTGGIAVPIDAQLGPSEMTNLLADSETKIIFHSTKTWENVRETGEELSSRYGLQVKPVDFDSSEFRQTSSQTADETYPEISEDDIASIIYTSGTTGNPKGVMLTHGNFCSDADALIEAGILSHDDNVLGVLPLHHTYPFMGNLLIPLSLGISITYPQSLKGPDLMSAMREKNITILVSVPQLLELIRNGIFNKIRQLPLPLSQIMLNILKICGVLRQKFALNLGKTVFRSVHKALGEKFRFFACGGAKLDPQIMKDLEALGFTVLEGYGLTETSPVVTFNPIEKRKPASVGKTLPSAEIMIIDPEKDTTLNEMQEGEIIIRGPMVMKGYYKNTHATEQVLKDGWFHSGDLGYFDHEGYLFITGRLKEVIVLSSGKNIYPDEVEKQYLKIPLIREICVLGIEEKGMIESLQAIMVPDFEYAKKEQIGNIHEVLKWDINKISLTLPQYMRIKGYTLHPEPLPRTPLGKLRRFMVRDLLTVKSSTLRESRQEDKGLIEDEIGRKVIECIKPLLKEKTAIQSKDNLELDLGLDSLAKLELVVALEETFSIKLPETIVFEIQTVSELVTKIKEYETKGVGKIEKAPAWKDILQDEPVYDDRKKVGLHHTALEKFIMFIGLQFVKTVTKVLFRVKSEGIENIPEQGPYIIAPNHASYLDGFCVVSGIPSTYFQSLYLLGIQKYFTGGVKGLFARLAHVIPIDPETYINRALQISSYVLRNGKALLIFPEGGRSFDGELMEFKKGVGILAYELNVPVVPVYIKGSYEALPRTAWWPTFSEIKILFGKQLHPNDIDLSGRLQGKDAYQIFVDTLKERVQSLRDLKNVRK